MGFLRQILTRATPENPRFSLYDPDAWDAFGAEPASSGIRVSREVALTYSAWWRAITLLAGDAGKLPTCLYRRRAGGGLDKDCGHPAYHLIRHQPNTFQTAQQFKMQLTGHAIATGNGYAYITPRGDGGPGELLPLDPEQTWPVRETDMQAGTTKIWYVLEINNQQRKIDPARIFHLPGFGFDGIQGYNVIDKAREALGLGLATNRYASVFFRNNGTPRIVLTVPGKMSDPGKEKLRADWERMQAGIDNAHRTAILDMGLEAKPISFDANAAQLTESRKLSPLDVSNYTGVPPHMLGDREQAAYNSLESEKQAYLDNGLDFWLVNWETQLWNKLLTEGQKRKESHHFAFDRRELLKANLAARGSYYVQALTNGWMCRDEVREDEHLNPIPDGAGQKFLVPLNMGQSPAADPKADPGKAPPEPFKKIKPDKPKAKKRQAIRRLLEEVAGRMVRRLTTHARRSAATARAFGCWLDRVDAETDAIRAALEAPLAVAGGGDAAASAAYITGHLRGELLELSGQCREADLAGRVETYCAEAERTWPAQIAAIWMERPD